MATKTEEFLTGTGTTISFTTQYINESDIKVRVDGGSPLTFIGTTGTPTTGQYKIAANSTTITFGDNQNGKSLHIYSETDVSSPTVSFTAGSSIKAADLQSIETLVRHGIKESRNDIVTHDIRDAQITSAKILDGTITDADISGSAAIAQSKIATGQLPSGITINSANIVNGSIVNDDVSNSAAIAGTKITPDFGSQNIVTSGTVDGRNVSVDGTKLDTIETNAKDDQTASEIKTLYESNANTNAYTDAEKTKLTNIETSATADQTAAEIKTLLQSDKLTDSEIATGTLDNRYYTETELDAGQLDNRYYTEAELNGGQLNSLYFTESEITGGAADGRYYTETELDAGQLDNRYYTETELNAGQLDNRYYTETESEALFLRQDSSETIASGVTWASNDSKVATTAAIDLRIIDLVDDVGGFVAIANETSFPTANPDVNNGAGTIVSVKAASTNLTPSSGTVTIANGAGSGNTVTVTGVTATIPSGFGFLVETTSTLHTYSFHRLVPKATEVSTVAANAASIAAAGANVTDINSFADRYQISTSAPTTRSDNSALVAGDLWFDSSSNKVMMVYDASAGDGFSPITPNQATLTNINIVAGQVTFTEDLGNITDAINTGSGNNSINTVGSNIASVNTTAGSIANVNTVATNIANVNTVGGSIANVNTVGASIADVNRYAAEYLIQSATPSSPSAGDLWYNSTANNLNYYTGGAWVAIAPGIAGVINDPNPALANHLDCNDKNLTEVGTVSGNNLQIDFGTL